MSLRGWAYTIALSLTFWALFFGSLFAAGALGRCRTHKCWHRVSVARHVKRRVALLPPPPHAVLHMGWRVVSAR
jgi:hypothetical protein